MSIVGLQLGRYRLIRLIGSGGMGEVYLAEDTHIDRQVAIKLFRNEGTHAGVEGTKKAARLFQREMKAIAKLDHPHILPLFDYGEESVSGLLLTYMVMSFRKEGSLAAWLRQHTPKPLTPEHVEHFLQQAADALQHAHDRQIIHRDVKLSNFLIRSTKEKPDHPDLLLADFGIAKFNTPIPSVSSAIRGTPTYMAPEQWKGQAFTATDQYALAVMVYELLTGGPPFTGGLEQVMYQHLNAPPDPPGTLNSSIPPGIDSVLLRALEKKPEGRFDSISAFAHAFQEVLRSPDPSVAHTTAVSEEAAQSTNSPTIPNSARSRQVLLLTSTPTTPEAPKATQPLHPIGPPIIHHAPGLSNSDNIGMVLAISKAEAFTGGSYTLTLPGGKHVVVSVPADAYDGQVIRLEDQGEPDSRGKPAGALLLTLAIAQHTEESSPISDLHKIEQSPPQSTINGNIPALSTSGLAIKQKLGNRWRGLSKGKLLVLIGLLLLVSVESAGLLYFAGTNRMSATNARATTTAEARSIAIAYSATASARVTATAGVLLNPYPPYGGTLVLNDPLHDNSKGYNWDVNTGGCQFSAGGYLVRETLQGHFQYCTARTTDFSNFAYQAQMTIINGDYGGLIFRANAVTGQYYYFRIGRDGSYILIRYVDNQNVHAQILTDGVVSVVRTNPNQPNLIAVVARGSTIDLYINHKYITTAHDNTYSHGQIAVVAEDEGNSTGVLFSDAKVWAL
jgi:serine/threonine protein kinase